MTLLQKIIFVADFLDPLRRIDSSAVYEAAFKDLDKAVFMVLDDCIISLIKRKIAINTLSLEARNYYLEICKPEDN